MLAMTLTEAKRIIGSIGFPSKMPGTSYALPARNCIAGAALVRVPGSICSGCYALNGKASYQRPRAALGLQKRLVAIGDPRWVNAMVRVLNHLHASTSIKGRWREHEPGFHRWHDSGDLQSVEHYEKILEVCRRTPRIRHWLPTRELAILRGSSKPVPENLTVRVSATMIDGAPPKGWPVTSTVHTKAPPAGAWECQAYRQDHQCLSCRACWSRDVALVSYLRH